MKWSFSLSFIDICSTVHKQEPGQPVHATAGYCRVLLPPGAAFNERPTDTDGLDLVEWLSVAS